MWKIIGRSGRIRTRDSCFLVQKVADSNGYSGGYRDASKVLYDILRRGNNIQILGFTLTRHGKHCMPSAVVDFMKHLATYESSQDLRMIAALWCIVATAIRTYVPRLE